MDYCQRCGTKTNGNTYCEQCDKELFTMSDTAQKLLSNELPITKVQKDISIQKRYCITCGKEAKIGSRYCKEHYDEMRKNARIDTHKVYDTIFINTSYFEDKNHKQTPKRIDGYNAGDFERWNKSSYTNETQYKYCIICGQYSYGHQYCSKCFYKTDNFNNKYSNDLKYKCKSGILVRSLSEREISNYLTEHNINHEYEKELKYSKYNFFTDITKKGTLHPDFYIKGPVKFNNRILKDIYIEFWGLDNQEYIDQKNFKLKVYNALNITLINLYKEDLIDLEKQLEYKFSNYKTNKINY